MIAAAVASGYLTTLFLQLNPAVSIDPGTLVPLATVLAIAYGANLTVLFYALIVMRQILAVEVLSPGWLSVRLLSWLCTAAASAGATLMWLNLLGFEEFLDRETRDRMFVGATLVTAAGIGFLILGLAHLSRRGGRVSATILSLTMVLSVAMPLVARGPARQPPLPGRPTAIAGLEPAPLDRRITVLMFDGASLDFILRDVAAGRLPNFGRVIDQGAVLHLATLRPTQAAPVWTAVATGRYPIYNGVRSAAVYRVVGGTPIQLLPDYCFSQALVTFGFLSEEPQTVDDLQARPIWNILNDRGASVGLIGWPLTQPAPRVNGFAISDVFHRLPESEMNLDATPLMWPPDLLADARMAIAAAASPDPVALVSTFGFPQPVTDYDMSSDRAPVVADRVHQQLLSAFAPDAPVLMAARFPGIDAVGHRFLRYADPSAFGDVSEEETQKFGRVLQQYYGFLDTLVGREMERLGANDLLLMVSAFGMEPISPGRRVLQIIAGDPLNSGSHEGAPDGFLLAFGSPVEKGRKARASLVDLAPTILYFLGLPVGRDMDGFARIDLFNPAFTSDKPVTYIPSYGR